MDGINVITNCVNNNVSQKPPTMTEMCLAKCFNIFQNE